MCDIFCDTKKYEEVDRDPGDGDHGEDIVLTSSPFGFENVEIPLVCRCLVQVKSCAETMTTAQSIEDPRKAFNTYQDVNCGLIISTVTDVSQEFRANLDKFSEEIGKAVALLYERELARFILKHL
jgi:hypothetical protein